MQITRTLGSLIVFTVFFLQATPVWAGEYTVRPFLVDHVAEPRDVITDTVVLTNDNLRRKYTVYATVNEISVDEVGEIKQFVSPVMTDRTNTVTSWIEVTRGRIDIEPGGTREIPLTFRINPKAEPGVYHAFIGFVPAPNRPQAESVALNGEADGVLAKITIEDKREDSMKITSFLINRFITGEAKREISIEVENYGDIASAPKGEIVFYDSRGVEIGSTPVNEESFVIQPGETATLKALVPIEETLGRFKANLSLQYGEQRASLFDTTFFYLMPLQMLLLIFGGILIIAILAALLFKKAFMFPHYEDDEGDEVMVYVREGHEPNPQDHDIDLKNNKNE